MDKELLLVDEQVRLFPEKELTPGADAVKMVETTNDLEYLNWLDKAVAGFNLSCEGSSTVGKILQRHYSWKEESIHVADFIAVLFWEISIATTTLISQQPQHLLFGRKAMTDLDSILKNKDITLLTKVPLVKAMVFPVVMYGCESWTIKKTEHQRINAFELWCWRRLLRVPWTARRSNQSILKEISPGCSLEGLMLKLQYFGHLKWRADSLEKTLPDAGKHCGQEEKRVTEDEMVGWHHQLNGHGFQQTRGDGEGQRTLVCCSSWGRKKVDVT